MNRLPRVLLATLLPMNLFAQAIPDPVRPPLPDTLFLRLVSPGRDTVRAMSQRVRVAGCTLPTAKAFINNEEVKVYGSGVFVGSVTLKADTMPVRIVVRGERGDSLSDDFVALRPQPQKDFPHDTLVIDPRSIQPSETMWLAAGDVLEVGFAGSPGWEATFSIPGVKSGIPMRECSPAEVGGRKGIYQGRYVFTGTDEVPNEPVQFKLKKSFWSSVKVESRDSITVIPGALPRVGEVTGKRPFLNVGLGGDRLGGAKLGYLVPGVQLEISGKVGRQYRVRLGESMEAWIPEDYVTLLPPETPLPRSLAGSISASGTDSVDVVFVSLSKRLPYTSEQIVTDKGTALAVDVYGATSNTNWITHNLTAKVVESVRWNQVGADHYRLLIALRPAYHWGYDIDYSGSSLRVKVRRPPVIASKDSVLAGLTIALDAGHGGDADGAVGVTGAKEKNANLSIIRHLDTLLTARGVRVVLTRSGDEGPSMADRTDTILGSGAQILVSVHCNSGGATSDPPGARGVSTYYRHIGYKPLADILYARLLEIGLSQFGVVGSFNFSLNAPTQLPNVLVETAFFSHPEDEMLLLDDGFRTSVAQKIVAGLEEYVRLAAGTP